MKNLVIIPTYNERENILKLIEGILDYCPDLDILVIDDNSPDGTAGLIKSKFGKNPRVFLIVREKKMGLGTALLEGYRFAVNRCYEFLIQMDADFSHDFYMIEEFLNNAGTQTIVIGSRYIKGGGCVGWGWQRKLLSKFANLYVRFWLQLKVKDATTGFRLFPVKFLKELINDEIFSSGYLFQIEIIWKATKKGYIIKEIPIIFRNRRKGRSKLGRIQILEAIIGVPILLFKS